MIIFAGIISALAILFVLFKFAAVKRVLAFEKWIDIGATALLTFLFFGTLGGMVAAIIGGAVISIILWAMRKTIGCDKLTIRGWKKGDKPQLQLKGASKWKQVLSYWQSLYQ
tara:strand:+ start:290 stop:625 length:336 start_codon:yes stop_codon:yes gene_type:complete